MRWRADSHREDQYESSALVKSQQEFHELSGAQLSGYDGLHQ